MWSVEGEARFLSRTETVENNGWCRGGAWLYMLMIGVRQAQQALRLITTRLSAAGQRPLPHTEIDQHWQTGRENMLLHSPAAHRLTDRPGGGQPERGLLSHQWMDASTGTQKYSADLWGIYIVWRYGIILSITVCNNLNTQYIKYNLLSWI